jgi:hypothetical protein
MTWSRGGDSCVQAVITAAFKLQVEMAIPARANYLPAKITSLHAAPAILHYPGCSTMVGGECCCKLSTVDHAPHLR